MLIEGLSHLIDTFRSLSLWTDYRKPSVGSNADIHVIVKIESADSIKNLHSIIVASDGVSSNLMILVITCTRYVWHQKLITRKNLISCILPISVISWLDFPFLVVVWK